MAVEAAAKNHQGQAMKIRAARVVFPGSRSYYPPKKRTASLDLVTGINKYQPGLFGAGDHYEPLVSDTLGFLLLHSQLSVVKS